MTNKEALSILHCPDSVGGLYSEKYGEALNMAMKALKREPCEDCISRQVVLEQLNVYCKANCKYTKAEQDVMCRACDTGSCIELIEDMPSVTPTRARGKWMTEHNKGYVQCSNCHTRVPFCKRSNFCPNCGADMRGEEDEDSD